jgi:hypothetical protein
MLSFVLCVLTSSCRSCAPTLVVMSAHAASSCCGRLHALTAEACAVVAAWLISLSASCSCVTWACSCATVTADIAVCADISLLTLSSCWRRQAASAWLACSSCFNTDTLVLLFCSFACRSCSCRVAWVYCSCWLLRAFFSMATSRSDRDTGRCLRGFTWWRCGRGTAGLAPSREGAALPGVLCCCSCVVCIREHC